jgi:TonB family protein
MSIASLDLNRKRFEEARADYKKLLEIDPGNRDAYYSIAFTIWSQWYPAYGSARAKLGMRAEDPGPIADLATRNALRAQWWTLLDEGLWNLNRALEIDPMYSDAMAYMNLFIRERADLRDTKDDYVQDVKQADDWVRKALEAKKAQVGRIQGSTVAPTPPPPPPPPGGAPQRIVIGGNVQSANLVARVDPVYPDLARQAKVEGVVKLRVIVGKDGQVIHIEVLSGHPLLVASAIGAVQQWKYRQTLLNGEPVEVRTDVDVNFALSN